LLLEIRFFVSIFQKNILVKKNIFFFSKKVCALNNLLRRKKYNIGDINLAASAENL
jgi:hypothetical protein